jgi:hypothetical protein
VSRALRDCMHWFVRARASGEFLMFKRFNEH